MRKLRRTSFGDSMGNLTRLVVDMSRQTVLVAASTLLLMTATYFAGKWIGSSVSQDQHLLNGLTREEALYIRNNDFLEVSKILNDPKTTNIPPHLGSRGGGADGKEGEMVPDDDEVEEEEEEGDPIVTPENIPSLPDGGESGGLPEEITTLSATKTILTSEIFSEGWVRDVPDLCQGQKDGGRAGPAPTILAIVISAPTHAREREAIRTGWGRWAEHSHGGVAVVHLVGRPSPDELANSEDILRRLEEESDKHGDLAITDNIDTYKNLTLKTLAAFRWAQSRCPEADFVLKVDDDVFVQVPRLLAMAKSLAKSQNLAAGAGAAENGAGLAPSAVIAGNVASGWKPVRNPKSKYFITPEQYDAASYPPFVTGPSYLVSRSAVDLLLSGALQRPFFHLEDVFVTGIVAEEVGVPRRNAPEFRNNANPIPVAFLGCTLTRTVSIHKVKPVDQAKLFLMAKNPKCGNPDGSSIHINKKKKKKKAGSL